MHGLSGAGLIDVVDRCRRLNHLDIGLALAALAGSADTEALWRLPIGVRDQRLLRLRATTLGPAINLRTSCPACDAPLDLVLDAHALIVPDAPAASPSLRINGRSWRLAPADTEALAAAARSGLDDARAAVAAACLHPEDGGPRIDPETLSATVLEKIAEHLAKLDPQADLTIALACAACDASWTTLFDIAAVFHEELKQRAGALLQDVHEIARVYHWSEKEILALEQERRQTYLALIRDE